MDFSLDAEQGLLQESARRFAQTELPELAVELEEKAEPVPQAWMRRYAEMGFLGINTDSAYGGLGLPHLDALLVVEEFDKVSVAVGFRSSSAAPGRCGSSNASAHRRSSSV